MNYNIHIVAIINENNQCVYSSYELPGSGSSERWDKGSIPVCPILFIEVPEDELDRVDNTLKPQLPLSTINGHDSMLNQLLLIKNQTGVETSNNVNSNEKYIDFGYNAHTKTKVG
ncbi:hypothetical protein ACTFIR_007524 [Dictyostelium discoideum]